MTLLGDVFGSINPFSSETEREGHQHNIEKQTINLLHSAQATVADAGLDAFKFIGKHLGFDLSDEMATHYQDGDGKTLNLPKEKLEKFNTIKKAENTNQTRILNSITKSGTLFKKDKDGSLEPVNLDQLKNHEKVYMKDYYDVDENESKDIANKDLDLSTSLGSFKLRSKSNIELVKSGNKLLPYGNVEHTINDKYDFNNMSLYEPMARPLEQSYKAKPYEVKSQWKNMPVGVITIHDDKIDTSGIEWHSTP
jgi:hypothetical protein